MKKKKKPKIHRDKHGEFIYQKYFVRGKMKLENIYIVDGIPAQEFYEQNADPITLVQNGDYDILYARELEDNVW
jgi:hypothetical protein